MGFNTGSYNSAQYNADSETITLIQGDITAQTSFTGSILSSKILTGTISGETNTSASLTAFDQRTLSGTITGETGFFGDITDFDKRRLSGSLQTQTSLTANLAAIQPLSGTINTQTSLTGALTTFDQRTLSGTITGTTTNSGQLSTAKLITGTIKTDTGLTGDLTAFDQRLLKATSETTTNITGDLTAFDQRLLKATAETTTNVTGDLTAFDQRLLKATAETTTNITGHLTTKDFRTLTGAVEASSELTGQIRITQLVSGSTNVETSFKGLVRAEEIQPIYQRFTPQKMYSIGRKNAENLAGQIDDPANRPAGQLVYKSKPRVKSQRFNGYPFIVVEQFQLNDFQDTVNNLNTEWDFDVELHVFGRENNEKQLNQFENILNQLTALTQTDKKHELNKKAGISRLQVIRQNRLTGINEKDQPIIRYEYVIRGKLHVGMDVFEDRT